MKLPACLTLLAALVTMSYADITVSWKQKEFRGIEQYHLMVSSKNIQLPSSLVGDYLLKFVLRCKEYSVAWNQTQKEETIDAAFPIRVAGQAAPQVLVISTNSWGQHVKIFTVGNDSVNASFGCSTRGLGALKWTYGKNGLSGITFSDRWDPAASKRIKPSEPGIHWMRVLNYKFDAKKMEWVLKAGKWKSWNVNDDHEDKALFEKYKDCPFRFVGVKKK